MRSKKNSAASTQRGSATRRREEENEGASACWRKDNGLAREWRLDVHMAWRRNKFTASGCMVEWTTFLITPQFQHTPRDLQAKFYTIIKGMVMKFFKNIANFNT